MASCQRTPLGLLPFSPARAAAAALRSSFSGQDWVEQLLCRLSCLLLLLCPGWLLLGCFCALSIVTGFGLAKHQEWSPSETDQGLPSPLWCALKLCCTSFLPAMKGAHAPSGLLAAQSSPPLPAVARILKWSLPSSSSQFGLQMCGSKALLNQRSALPIECSWEEMMQTFPSAQGSSALSGSRVE